MVDFRPHSPRAELFRWYCVSDVVGVPSHNESFGLVALEAQACGRPVVATDVGGLRHAVDDGPTGLLVPGHDPAEWADRARLGAGRPGGSQWLGATAAVHAATFSWSNTAASTLRAYGAAQRAYARADRPDQQLQRAVRQPLQADAAGQDLASAAVSGSAMSSSDLFSASTPRNAGDDAADDHQRGPDEVAGRDPGDVTGLRGVADQGAEQQRTGDAAGGRPIA